MVKAEQALQIIKDHWANKKFVIHNCSICEYPCGFIFREGLIFYDSGCYCIDEKMVEERNDEFFLHYLRKNPDVIEKAFEEERISVQ